VSLERQLPGCGSYVYDHAEGKGWKVWDYHFGTSEVEFIDSAGNTKRMSYEDFRDALHGGVWKVTSQRGTQAEPEQATKVLYLMQGVPGSGKSTVARMIADFENYGRSSQSKGRAVILSTDDHRLESDGSYRFDPADNERFHRLTQQDCARLMAKGKQVIIIDNTNIAEWQARPYLVLAGVWGYAVQVVSVDCGLAVAIARQGEREGLGDRKVPAPVIGRMYAQMERLLHDEPTQALVDRLLQAPPE
jgi:predicted kinase